MSSLHGLDRNECEPIAVNLVCGIVVSYQFSVFSQQEGNLGNNAPFTGWETSKKSAETPYQIPQANTATEYSKLRKIVTKNPLNRQPITDD